MQSQKGVYDFSHESFFQIAIFTSTKVFYKALISILYRYTYPILIKMMFLNIAFPGRNVALPPHIHNIFSESQIFSYRENQRQRQRNNFNNLQ